jgi:GNAT superfamily N-acetyltransferase
MVEWWSNGEEYPVMPDMLVKLYTLSYACHDATYRNFFGPTGVSEAHRGRGIGKALLLVCLHAMKTQGYAYAIIGWVGPPEFYTNAVGTVAIEDSEPGIYGGLLTE